MTVKRLTPNLYADDVEACVKFWVERMHFEVTAEVPGEGGLAFAALQTGTIELMYGSYASLDKEVTVTGSGECLEVWDRAQHKANLETLLVEIPDLTASLGHTA